MSTFYKQLHRGPCKDAVQITQNNFFLHFNSTKQIFNEQQNLFKLPEV